MLTKVSDFLKEIVLNRTKSPFKIKPSKKEPGVFNVTIDRITLQRNARGNLIAILGAKGYTVATLDSRMPIENFIKGETLTITNTKIKVPFKVSNNAY